MPAAQMAFRQVSAYDASPRAVLCRSTVVNRDARCHGCSKHSQHADVSAASRYRRRRLPCRAGSPDPAATPRSPARQEQEQQAAILRRRAPDDVTLIRSLSC
jgi:hypothetical protein